MRSFAKGIVCGAAGMVVLCAGMEAGAQQVLTLDGALEIAEERNPAYRQAFNSVGLNSSEMRNTWLNQILPRVEWSGISSSRGKKLWNCGKPRDETSKRGTFITRRKLQEPIL